MAISFILPLRIAQTVFAIIVLGLTAYVANWWTGYWHDSAPAEINFLLFASVWSLVALIYLVVAPLKFASHPMSHKFAILGAEAVSMLFWFGGFIALAVFLSNRVCFGHVCNVAKAATVFAAFEW
ncbi:hypothetical protein K402DRAFT_324260 [Aulographum hederae CBS 113979]|uniref:MARVEL domain-containing protein n=1 Tax=Aulographum hederae CBS 113979 TaxID=1176131 RepID=A0A6G1HBP2_9PEZI|nr:hypothetical protein K402DRAFT_324260 [Aulographum hederae CBS 113979]